MRYGSIFLLLLLVKPVFAQIEVKVHVWGEVRNPGEYYVPAGINVLELISKAGGPTEYGNLGRVRLTRDRKSFDRVVRIDLSDYLKKKRYDKPIPVVENGDIVDVPRNWWYKWRTTIRVAADVAIVANAYYWFTRGQE
jgi:protein involved in polysaccharide export with SLBB domain